MLELFHHFYINNTNDYLMDTLQAYINKNDNKLNSNKLHYQYEIDFHRALYKYNDYKLFSMNFLRNQLSKYKLYNIKLNNELIFNFYDILFMCLSQGAFAFPYIYMAKQLVDDNECLCSNDIEYHIFEKLDQIQIKIITSFLIKNIKTEIVRKQINAEFVIDFFLNKHHYYTFPEYVVLNVI